MEWHTRGTLVFSDVGTSFHSTDNDREKELWVPRFISTSILRLGVAAAGFRIYPDGLLWVFCRNLRIMRD